MKLKKLFALALAGVMALVLLTGCESLSPWERWHCEAMTERASPFPKSICTAISIGFCQSDAIAVLFVL